ncbi:class I SAM-dependent methyltransferase [Cloacibacterium sp. TD35]|uniref:class I SAM-dependent methyltransferase n=1 Tax=Cloacibacterium sp. TD35 TaxID=2976818 RepID=UPI00237D4534|nr:class I SAM-dependent methyltransferase [Cloacibacterium sp. TD35]WDT68686.1 methyltransferase domain-containing protein [Cloacibacterium sp. TD35]
MKKEEVSQFYDQFSERQIKIGVNERLIYLFKKLKKLGLNKKSKILELGCGVGAFTYLLSKKVEQGYVEAVDLSEKSIENAQKNIQKSNVRLFVGDVVYYQPKETDFDFITLLDVIEHIPVEEHFNLFKNLSSFISEKTLLLINIPNPEYIKYLHQNLPDSLQVIDQPIELTTLAENLDKNDLEIIFFQKYGIWEQEDYHLFVVRKKREFKLRHLADERTLTQKIIKKHRQKIDFIKFS